MDRDRSRDRFLEANRAFWDSLVSIHQRSAFYNLEAFLAGGSSLLAIEREEVGSVEGCRLLHLQCHFGMDTLSWARLGAEATGVDFSPRAIEAACTLRDRLGLAAEFICSDLYDLPQRLEKRFQIVCAERALLAARSAPLGTDRRPFPGAGGSLRFGGRTPLPERLRQWSQGEQPARGLFLLPPAGPDTLGRGRRLR
ncbi:MAG: methyltransferase domain-containing protein [bacterium]